MPPAAPSSPRSLLLRQHRAAVVRGQATRRTSGGVRKIFRTVKTRQRARVVCRRVCGTIFINSFANNYFYYYIVKQCRGEEGKKDSRAFAWNVGLADPLFSSETELYASAPSS